MITKKKRSRSNDHEEVCSQRLADALSEAGFATYQEVTCWAPVNASKGYERRRVDIYAIPPEGSQWQARGVNSIVFEVKSTERTGDSIDAHYQAAGYLACWNYMAPESIPLPRPDIGILALPHMLMPSTWSTRSATEVSIIREYSDRFHWKRGLATLRCMRCGGEPWLGVLTNVGTRMRNQEAIALIPWVDIYGPAVLREH